jgi:saccharopine dehydrogenase-like NADP-dependent oxidoreductase
MIGPVIVAHYYHACTGKIPTYRDGKWIEIPSLSEQETVDFPSPLGRIEVSHVGHPEPMTIPRYIKEVKVVTNKGTIYPEHPFNDRTKLFADSGWSSLKEIPIKGVSMPARDLVVALTLASGELATPGYARVLMKSALERFGEEYLRGLELGLKLEESAKGKEHDLHMELLGARQSTLQPFQRQ